MFKNSFRVGLLASLLASAALAPAMADISAAPGLRHANSAGAIPADQNVASAEREKFEMLKPGVYTEFEKGAVAAYLAENEAIRLRGEIDIDALVSGTLPAGTPGLGPIIHVTEEWVRYQHEKFDPQNPLRHDAEVARKAGYKGVPAYPSFAAHDDSSMIPWPVHVRDKLLVSDLNHSITNYAPVYAGDTLYIVVNQRDVLDLTPPEGSTRRAIAIISQASIYNQDGDKVTDMTFRVTEQLSVYKDRADAPEVPIFPLVWESADWLSRAEHVYTDADWDKIKDIWANEDIRGATPRYWEDVTIGDQPTQTLDGPISEGPTPTWGMGMGSGGSRNLRPEIMDEDGFADLVRNPNDGIYRLADPNLQRPQMPPLPEYKDAPPPPPRPGAVDVANIHTTEVGRGILVNFTGRDYAIRHITNWMGDAGWIKNISWSIMDPRAGWEHGVPIVPNPVAQRYVNRVPGMENAFVSTHGLTKDVALVKSQVTDKRVVNGKFEVELIWWIETIDGHIWEEGQALVELPSREGGVASAVPAAN
jgi:hypothetical protein